MLLIYGLNKLGANIMFTLDRSQYSELLFCCLIFCISHSIDLLHKYHNTPVPWPTIHHFVTEMCPCVHISVTKWCTVRQLCNAWWDLCDGHIAPRISRKCFPHHWTLFERNPLVMHGFSAQESSDGDFLYVSFDVNLTKLLNKQSKCSVIELAWRSLDVIIMDPKRWFGHTGKLKPNIIHANGPSFFHAYFCKGFSVK